MHAHIIQSYVYHTGPEGERECFFISTANRRCSALASDHVYAETIVWSIVPGTSTRGSILCQAEDLEDSIERHIDLCRLYREWGLSQDELEQQKGR